MTEQFYKVLGPGQVSCHGGSGKWVKGRWRSVEGDLVPCKNGIHLCRRQDLVIWLDAQIWEAEYDGEVVTSYNKVVVSRARIVKRLTRWNARTQRLFAADCVEKALTLIPSPDPRGVEAIRVARLFARGKATRKRLGAAWDAAWDAARGDVWDAAWAAALGDAWGAAWGAAWDAARDAAWGAAWGAAWAAARGAAWGDPWAAARDAAWDAAREWQTEVLFDYLEERRK